MGAGDTEEHPAARVVGHGLFTRCVVIRTCRAEDWGAESLSSSLWLHSSAVQETGSHLGTLK